MTETEYDAALARICKLMEADPLPDTDEGKELMRLVDAVEAYERDKYPMFNDALFDEVFRPDDRERPA